MKVFDELLSLASSTSFIPPDLAIERQCPISLVSKPKEPKRILSLPEDALPRTDRFEIRLVFSDLLSGQVDFIRSTILFISEMLDCTIYIDSEVAEESTHVIVNSNPNGLCRRTHKYLFSLLCKKSIVSFLWYSDLFEASKRISSTDYTFVSPRAFIEQITKYHIVKGDECYGDSAAPELAHKSTLKVPLLKGLEIYDINKILSNTERELIKKTGGRININRATKKSKIINDKEEFFNMISSGEIFHNRKERKKRSEKNKTEKEKTEKKRSDRLFRETGKERAELSMNDRDIWIDPSRRKTAEADQSEETVQAVRKLSQAE